MYATFMINLKANIHSSGPHNQIKRTTSPTCVTDRTLPGHDGSRQLISHGVHAPALALETLDGLVLSRGRTLGLVRSQHPLAVLYQLEQTRAQVLTWKWGKGK